MSLFMNKNTQSRQLQKMTNRDFNNRFRNHENIDESEVQLLSNSNNHNMGDDEEKNYPDSNSNQQFNQIKNILHTFNFQFIPYRK